MPFFQLLGQPYFKTLGPERSKPRDVQAGWMASELRSTWPSKQIPDYKRELSGKGLQLRHLLGKQRRFASIPTSHNKEGWNGIQKCRVYFAYQSNLASSWYSPWNQNTLQVCQPSLPSPDPAFGPPSRMSVRSQWSVRAQLKYMVLWWTWRSNQPFDQPLHTPCFTSFRLREPDPQFGKIKLVSVAELDGLWRVCAIISIDHDVLTPI